MHLPLFNKLIETLLKYHNYVFVTDFQQFSYEFFIKYVQNILFFEIVEKFPTKNLSFLRI